MPWTEWRRDETEGIGWGSVDRPSLHHLQPSVATGRTEGETERSEGTVQWMKDEWDGPSLILSLQITSGNRSEAAKPGERMWHEWDEKSFYIILVLYSRFAERFLIL